MKILISFLLRYVPRKSLQRVGKLGLRIIAFFYTGNNVACPICLHTYRKFVPYGRIRSRPALCPHCLSLERHRLLWVYLNKKTTILSTPQDVLHIAPEPCFVQPLQRCHGERYITGDLESPFAKIKMDIQQMPFADNQFNVVLCNHVLEHIEDDLKALREIHRVLKPGGWAVLQVPFYPPIPETTLEDPTVQSPVEREKKFGQRDHVRCYGKDYTQRISDAGMQPIISNLSTLLPPADIHRYGLNANELIYIGKK